MPCTAPGITVCVASAPTARSRATPAREWSGCTPTTPRRVPSRLPWMTRIRAPARGVRSSCSGIHGRQGDHLADALLAGADEAGRTAGREAQQRQAPGAARAHERDGRRRVGDERVERAPGLDPVAHLREADLGEDAAPARRPATRCWGSSRRARIGRPRRSCRRRPARQGARRSAPHRPRQRDGVHLAAAASEHRPIVAAGTRATPRGAVPRCGPTAPRTGRSPRASG